MYAWTYCGSDGRSTACASCPSECVVGRTPSWGTPPRGVVSTRPSSCTVAATASSVYHPPPQNHVGSRPRSRIHSASRRTRSAGSPPLGRACVGRVQCVCSPIRSSVRARSSHRASSSPNAGSGGRISASTAKRRRKASNRRHVSSSSGCSRWQETTAPLGTLFCGMCGISGLYSTTSTPQSQLVDEMRRRIAHRGPEQGSQPAGSESDDGVPFFTGELYNFRLLRDFLRALGLEIRGRGDTPVLP